MPLTPKQMEGLARLRALLARGNGELAEFLREQHPADLAEILEELTEQERTAVFRLLDDERAAEVLGELDVETQAEVVRALGKEKAGDIIEEMSTDDAADLLAELSPDQRGQILGEMAAEDAADVRELLHYAPETAGGRMTTDFVSLREDMTAQEAIEHLRREAPDAESIYYVYVLDNHDHLVGVISLRELIIAPPDALIRDVMRRKVVAVYYDQDQEEVARVVSKYNLLAVPVVDHEGRMLGMVTVDDVIDVLEEEATEDVLRLGATGAPAPEAEERGFAASVWALIRPRLPWLVTLLFLEMGTSVITDFFQRFVDDATASMLALFTVVMAGESGNAATQSLAVVVRGLATGEIRPGEMARVVLRESAAGLTVGAICGAVIGVAAAFMTRAPHVGLTVGLAMLVNLFVAKTLGGLFPVVINRLGIDPAVASGPFITTMTDNLSVFFFYGLAALLLRALAG